MLSRLFRRFGMAGPVAVVAVVAIAVAASVPAVADPVASTSANVVKVVKRALNLSKKANKRSRVASKRSRVALKAARNAEGTPGAPGPAGPQGPQGAAGPRGATGPQGPAGPAGATGEGVTATPEPPGVNCAEGGLKLDVGGDTRYVCNGADGTPGQPGDPWTAGGTLPPGETMTGTWSVAAGAAGAGVAAISFPIPLDPADADQIAVSVQDVGQPPPAGCTGGTPAEPKANPGRLCIYTGLLNNANQPPPGNVWSPTGPPSAGVSSGGAAMAVMFTDAGFAYGTYAVTAPAATP